MGHAKFHVWTVTEPATSTLLVKLVPDLATISTTKSSACPVRVVFADVATELVFISQAKNVALSAMTVKLNLYVLGVGTVGERVIVAKMMGNLRHNVNSSLQSTLQHPF